MEALARNGRLSVILVDPRNPLNIGAAARAMSNFGFSRLRLVNPYSVAFHEAVSAVGAGHVLAGAQVFDTLEAAVADCTLVVGATGLGHRQPRQILRRLESGARLLRRHLESAPAALLFGSEKFGLSNEALSFCHYLIRIPTREEHESMNLAQSVAVCLYELIRQPAAARRSVESASMASAEELDRFTALLCDTLHEAGYTDYATAIQAGDKTRRLVRRLNLTARDAPIWTGMLRQILWKLRHPDPRQDPKQ